MRKTTLLKLGFLLSLLSFSQCKEGKPYQDVPNMSQDQHSFAKPQEVQMTHLDLILKVSFESRRLAGIATIHIKRQSADFQELVLDTKALEIEKILLDDGSQAQYRLDEAQEFLGQALRISLKPETQKLSIYYKTSPEAEALQWLSPAQTAGKEQPFLFSQSQSILARSWVPCQDSPGIRFTYNAEITVPEGLMALMSATNPTEKNESGRYSFEMKQPIPAYLLALAVGDVVFQPIDERTGVYAEPAMLEASVKEFEDLGKMVSVAEKLYGAYEWERYDLLVLPPSFPFGGMENPRLTFATPTIIAGDKSLTSLVAHELAHSWSGNLVTNRTWNDFWLNEGFTVYFERRIIEALYNKDFADMEAVLGYQDLQGTLERMGTNNRDTKLQLDLYRRDPDEAVTDIAYEKGFFFLCTIEQAIGREAFDDFVKKYFKSHAFRAMDTQSFIQYLEKELIKGDKRLETKIRYKDWIFGTGLPDNCPVPQSRLFAEVDKQLALWNTHKKTDSLSTAAWSSQEWLHFIRHIERPAKIEDLKALDKAFQLTASNNAEVQAAWYLQAIHSRYEAAYPALEAFLIKVGRRKFLTPLYTALIQSPEGKKQALAIYAKAREGYHAVAIGTLDKLLDWKTP